MSNHQFENCEISDADLALVQGGNIFGDIWRGVKKVVEKIAKTVKTIVDAYGEITKFPPPTFPHHY